MDDKFYSDQIKLNKNLLKSDKKKKRKRAIRNLLELRGRLLFELRTAKNEINNILNNPNYEE
tara:strand:+ start:225 stop:410 length:186 start_codon:yes stop_codon:yes gene_type:complete